MGSWREFGEGLEVRVIESEFLLRWDQQKNTACVPKGLTLILAQVSAFQIT